MTDKHKYDTSDHSLPMVDVHVQWIACYGSKVDHLLMPGPDGPELENSFSSHQDRFPAQHNIISA